jgi:hypothetical protein
MPLQLIQSYIRACCVYSAIQFSSLNGISTRRVLRRKHKAMIRVLYVTRTRCEWRSSGARVFYVVDSAPVIHHFNVFTAPIYQHASTPSTQHGKDFDTHPSIRELSGNRRHEIDVNSSLVLIMVGHCSNCLHSIQ